MISILKSKTRVRMRLLKYIVHSVDCAKISQCTSSFDQKYILRNEQDNTTTFNNVF